MGIEIPKNPENIIHSSKLIKQNYYNNIVNKNYFDFLYIIGRGGFGKVWKVKLKKTNEYFALKEMSKMKIIDRRSEISIMSEKTLLSKLNNPFIVNMYFTFQDFSNLYLVMDLLTGGDLRYHLAKKKRFSERETKFFIANMLLALEYIHSKNIIHRDIKPENLVLELNGYLRITDFGVAKINEKDNSSETSGTPGYMAPEVILVQNHSFPSDFFALGVIGYEFMLGYRPYLGSSRKEIKDLIIYKQARLNECDIPYSWSLESGDFINKLLKRKPYKRLGYHGVKEIKNHLWMRDINWDLLKKKEIVAPFIPNPNRENFDKDYCERVEDIGETTIERYQEYVQSDLFLEVFEGYTYINIEYLQSKRNETIEKSQKKNKTNEENKRKESSSYRMKKNYSTNLTSQKKSISISQENNINNSNRHNRLKINLRKRNQHKNKNININSIKKKQTIDLDNKKEVLKRMSVNDNIKTNKNYLSNINNMINDNNKKEIDVKLKYDKEKLKKRAIKISSKMKEINNNNNEMNINVNLKNKNLDSKPLILNKSNSMKMLNSVNKDNINIILGNNLFENNNSKRKDSKNSFRNNSIKSKINKIDKKDNNENKNIILVEKKKSYKRYNISLNIKDKSNKKKEMIHKRTYDIIKKNKNLNIKGNNSQRNINKKNKILIYEENQSKDSLKKNENVIIKVNSNRKEENKIKKKDEKFENNKEIENTINNNKNENIKEIINDFDKPVDNKEIIIKIESPDLKEKNMNKIDDNKFEENKDIIKNIFNSNDKNEVEIKKERLRRPQSKIMLWIQNSLPVNPNNTINPKFSTIDNSICSNNNRNNNLNNSKNKKINKKENADKNKKVLNDKIKIQIYKNEVNLEENNKEENIKEKNIKDGNNKDEIIKDKYIKDEYNKDEYNKDEYNKDEYNKEEFNKNENNTNDDNNDENNKICENKIDNNIINNNINNIKINELIHESDITNKKNYKTITIDINNKYKPKKMLKKKYYKSLNNTKRNNFTKNNSCTNIYFDKQNLINKTAKSKSPKNTFLVFNTININLGNESKNFKRNRTPKIQVMKNINSSLNNIYLSNDILYEPLKFNNYLNKKSLEKGKGIYTTKKKLNIFKNNKLKRNNLNKNNNLNSENIKSI